MMSICSSAQVPAVITITAFGPSTGTSLSYLYLQNDNQKFVFGTSTGCWTSSGFGARLNSSNDTMWARSFNLTGLNYGVIENATFINNNFFVVGSQMKPGPTYAAYWIGKITQNGDTIFNRVFGTGAYEHLYSIKALPDGTLVAAGTEYFNGIDRASLFSFSSDGDQLWSAYYSSHASQTIRDFDVTEDGGFIVTGTIKEASDGPQRLWLAKTDDAGIINWEKSYSAPGNVEGDRIIAGNGYYYIIGTKPASVSSRNKCGWVLKCNAVGDTLWTLTLPDTNNQCGADMALESDGWIYALSSGWYSCPHNDDSEDFYLCKISNTGRLVWGGMNRGAGTRLTVLDSNNFLIAGSTLLKNTIYSTACVYTTKLNFPPVFLTQPSDMKSQINEDQWYVDTVHALDSDINDSVRYFLGQTAPAAMTIGIGTGIVSWLPTAEADSGNHVVSVYATDITGQKDTTTFTVHVTAVNDSPRIDTILKTVTGYAPNARVRLSAIVHDEENDSLVYLWLNARNDTIGRSQVLSIAREKRDSTTDTIVFKVKDRSISVIDTVYVVFSGSRTVEPMQIDRLPRKCDVEIAGKGVWLSLAPAMKGNVEIAIFDLSGRLIGNWSLPNVEAGFHQIRLNGFQAVTHAKPFVVAVKCGSYWLSKKSTVF
jgi:hypothetical protein